MLRSIWKDWLAPVVAPLVAALIGWRTDSTGAQGLAMVVSVTPNLIMAAVAGLMAFGLAKGAERVVPVVVSNMPASRFRTLLKRIQRRVNTDAETKFHSVYRSNLEKKQDRRHHKEIRDQLTALLIGGPAPNDELWVEFLEDLCLYTKRKALKQARNDYPCHLHKDVK